MSSPVPQELLEGVIRVFDPVEVWLFGSHARGDAHEDSDIDLFVVVDDDKKGRIKRGEAVVAARNGFRGPLDLFLATRSGFERCRSIIGTLDEIVAGEGVQLYARP